MRTLQQSAYEVLICADAAELAREAARRFAELAETFVTNNGRFVVALSGGSTPKAMFQTLADKPFADALPWRSIYFFWGDERCVPPDHPESNYRTANETLLSKVAVPRENIFRIPAEDEDHERAAAGYSETIRRFFNPVATAPGTETIRRFFNPVAIAPGTETIRRFFNPVAIAPGTETIRRFFNPVATAPGTETIRRFFNPVAIAPGTEPEWPRFDLIFLGMGDDGHTASLFPGTAALHANDRIVVANYVEKLQSWRITLTAEVINRARNIIFLVAGDDKAPGLKEVFEGERDPEKYPSQLIDPANGALLWMVDEAAARLLSG